MISEGGMSRRFDSRSSSGTLKSLIYEVAGIMYSPWAGEEDELLDCKIDI